MVRGGLFCKMYLLIFFGVLFTPGFLDHCKYSDKKQRWFLQHPGSRWGSLTLCAVKLEDGLYSPHHFLSERKQKHFTLRLLGKVQKIWFLETTRWKDDSPTQSHFFVWRLPLNARGIRTHGAFVVLCRCVLLTDSTFCFTHQLPIATYSEYQEPFLHSRENDFASSLFSFLTSPLLY